MQHAAGRWGLGFRPAQSVVAAFCRDEAAGSAWLEDLPRLTATPGLLQVCIQRAELEHQEMQKAACSRRRDSWREWSQQALANGGGRMYRWIRADGALAADLARPLWAPTLARLMRHSEAGDGAARYGGHGRPAPVL